MEMIGQLDRPLLLVVAAVRAAHAQTTGVFFAVLKT